MDTNNVPDSVLGENKEQPPIPDSPTIQITDKGANKSTAVLKLIRNPDTTGIDTKADKTREEDLHLDQTLKP